MTKMIQDALRTKKAFQKNCEGSVIVPIFLLGGLKKSLLKLDRETRRRRGGQILVKIVKNSDL